MVIFDGRWRSAPSTSYQPVSLQFAERSCFSHPYARTSPVHQLPAARGHLGGDTMMLLACSDAGRRINRNFISTPSQAISDSCCQRKGVMINTVTFAKISLPSWRHSCWMDLGGKQSHQRCGTERSAWALWVSLITQLGCNKQGFPVRLRGICCVSGFSVSLKHQGSASPAPAGTRSCALGHQLFPWGRFSSRGFTHWLQLL